jgi:hypothetical protein
VRVANRVQSFSFTGKPVKGPFLVMIVAGEYPEAQGYAPLRAYAQPILSGHRFIPVNSDLERDILHALLKARRQLADGGIDLLVEKPVFDLLTPAGPCRPDFLIEARSHRTGEIKQLILEMMEFGEREDQRRDRLRRIAPVLTVTTTDCAAGVLVARLTDALGL